MRSVSLATLLLLTLAGCGAREVGSSLRNPQEAAHAAMVASYADAIMEGMDSAERQTLLRRSAARPPSGAPRVTR